LHSATVNMNPSSTWEGHSTTPEKCPLFKTEHPYGGLNASRAFFRSSQPSPTLPTVAAYFVGRPRFAIAACA
jgi:hypothetical protein